MCLSSAFLGSMFSLSIQSADADSRIPKRIEAQEFRLVDDHGDVRARLTLRDQNGIQRPRLDFVENGGFNLVSIAVDNKNVPYIRLNNPDYPPMAMRQRLKADARIRPSERMSDD
jgi:hypothetical protein